MTLKHQIRGLSGVRSAELLALVDLGLSDALIASSFSIDEKTVSDVRCKFKLPAD
jgi:DNA-binding NarL/FixJ family response regulator